MTPIQVFDVGSGTTLKVNVCKDEALEPACLRVTPDGLVLHFNSDDGSGFNEHYGETVWLADVVAVGQLFVLAFAIG